MPRNCYAPGATQPDFVDSLATSLDMISRPDYSFEQNPQSRVEQVYEEAESPVIPTRARLSYRTEIPAYIQEFLSRDSKKPNITKMPSFEFDHVEMEEPTVGISRSVSTARSEPSERRSMYEFTQSTQQNFRQDRFSMGDSTSSIKPTSLSRHSHRILSIPEPRYNVKRKPVPLSSNGSPVNSQFLSPQSSLKTPDSLGIDDISMNDAIAAYISSPKLTQRIRLSCGRVISFSSVGDPAGFPVFCFLGIGVTRIMAGTELATKSTNYVAFWDDLASSLHLRIICPDRPGVGLSDPIPPGESTVLSWPEICQALNITRFSLMAHSLGCAYALATALLLPNFIVGSVHLLAPFIPTTQIKICKNHGSKEPNNITSLPTSQKLLSFLPTPILRAANNLLGPNTSPSGSSDELNKAIWNAATCTNTTPDLLTVLEKPHPLGFRYIDVDCRCIFYGGTKDTKVPVERIKWMGERMKDCRVRILNGLGHSLLSNARVLGEVLEGIRDESRTGGL